MLSTDMAASGWGIVVPSATGRSGVGVGVGVNVGVGVSVEVGVRVELGVGVMVTDGVDVMVGGNDSEMTSVVDRGV
jgi:hypothetical protein